MRNQRLFIPGGIHFITFRTEEGLPFIPLTFINMLICSALARAQRVYPIKIICFVVQANHVHLLIRVTDPQVASSFVGYFKAESAHYLNRLLNRRQRTVWAERFDSPAVLDLDKALECFAYCSLNPVKDGLVNSMSEYPGVASYNYLIKEQSHIPAKAIPRDKVPSLMDPHRPQRENLKLSEYFSSDKFEEMPITLSPDELRLAFPSSRTTSPEDFRKRILDTLAAYESLYIKQRSNKRPMGVAKLTSGSLLVERRPPSKGRKMICLSTNKELRQNFIASFKRLRELCRAVFKSWQQGKTHIPYPPGMFPPHLPRIANFVPRAIF
jgi:REP element-mobilizing transposase RayT